MKYIVKNIEPQEFVNWKNQTNDDWQPSFNNLQNPEKDEVFTSLLKEQGYICCYCERELKDNDYHIEHFRPQDQNLFPQLQLEYSNFLCSCQNIIKKGEPLHCGNSKDNWFDENLLISPIDDPNCEKQFTYTADGHIYPSNDNNAAKTTIKRLLLDINKLVNLRMNVIEPFLTESLSEDDFINFVNGYLVEKEENNGKYNEFHTTIKDLFQN